MGETNQLSQLPVLSQESVKLKINLALTAQNLFIQHLQHEASLLVLNEDHLEDISKFIARVKLADGIIDDKFVEIKAPYLSAGKVCDAVKNDLKASTAAIINPIVFKFQSLCLAIKQREALQKAEEDKEKQILSMIDSYVLDFSTKIAMCKTKDDLLSVERYINVQGSPSSAGKYGKFHQQAMSKYDEILLPIIKEQKIKIAQLEKLEAERKQAEASSDMDRLDALDQQKELIDLEINDNKVRVQENALNHESVHAPVYAKEILPSVKAKRTTWEAELHDVKAALKFAPNLLTIDLNKEAAKTALAALKGAGVLDGKEELISNGIRYFKKETF